jgi:hypothetical protein
MSKTKKWRLVKITRKAVELWYRCRVF